MSTLAEVFAAEERGEDPTAPVEQPRGSDGRYASEEPRSVAFVVRCTEQERERWKAAAGAEGLSAMVRRLLG